MIDLKEYPLRYACRKTNEEFPARITGGREIVIFRDGKIEKYSQFTIKEHYKASRENRKSERKPPQSRPIIKRGGFRNSKAFYEYLEKTGTN